MKAFILAAGLGTRLKPWTDSHPKALVPVKGVPMLQRVVERMYAQGITDITVNVHHFADQIIEFIKQKGWNINISHEREQLLDTGGALVHAARFLEGDEPVVVHNVDILSNADFNNIGSLWADATLLVSDRPSSRKLIFDDEMNLEGWHNLTSGIFRPEYMAETLKAGTERTVDGSLKDEITASGYTELAFSGIYTISPSFIWNMKQRGWDDGRFSIIDYLLETCGESIYKGYEQPDLEILDIGKPDSLNRANNLDFL